jgi:hypothetical protein
VKPEFPTLSQASGDDPELSLKYSVTSRHHYQCTLSIHLIVHLNPPRGSLLRKLWQPILNMAYTDEPFHLSRVIPEEVQACRIDAACESCISRNTAAHMTHAPVVVEPD